MAQTIRKRPAGRVGTFPSPPAAPPDPAIQLSARDSATFLESLKNPPKANDFLREAMRKYYDKV